MGERCPHSPLQTTGWLTGWRLTFGGEEHGWDGALATIVQDPIEQVFVALYDVSPQDEPLLDEWESADSGLYRKTRVRVATMTGSVVAGPTCSTPTRAGCRRRRTSGCSPTPPRPRTHPTTTSPASGAGPAARRVCETIGSSDLDRVTNASRGSLDHVHPPPPRRRRFLSPIAAFVDRPRAPAAPQLPPAVPRRRRRARGAVAAARPPAGLRDVMWVGNNWDGTASIVDARSFKVLKRGVNLIPDKTQELNDIAADPVALAFYVAIQVGPGEGHDQYVDDMFTTHDGRYLAVSRPSFADVVWVDVRRATLGRPGAIVREQQMDGYRTDHMGLSPDGLRLLVSDSTSRQVIEYAMVDQTLADGTEVEMGDRLRTFPTGETPHESNYTGQGGQIYHASIGKVYTPVDEEHRRAARARSSTQLRELWPSCRGRSRRGVKGDRWFQIVRSRNFKILKRWEIEPRARGGRLPRHEQRRTTDGDRAQARAYVYFQVSYFHGYVKFDTQAPDINGTTDYTLGGRARADHGPGARHRQPPEPGADHAARPIRQRLGPPRLSINRRGTTLCVAGTMDDYAALVDAGPARPPTTTRRPPATTTASRTGRQRDWATPAGSR